MAQHAGAMMTLGFVLASWAILFCAAYLIFGEKLALPTGAVMVCIWQAGTVAVTIDQST